MEVEPGEVESEEEPASQSRPSSSRQLSEERRSRGREDHSNLLGAAARAEPEVPALPQSSEASSSQYTADWARQASNTCGEYHEEHWCIYCQRKLEGMTKSGLCDHCWNSKEMKRARRRRAGANAKKNRENYDDWLKRYKELVQGDARFAALWKEQNPAPWVENNAFADASWVEQLVDDRVLQE